MTAKASRPAKLSTYLEGKPSNARRPHLDAHRVVQRNVTFDGETCDVAV